MKKASKGTRGARGSRRHGDTVAARREEKRLALLEAAVGVIRAEGPGVSMDQIARAADVAKPILYRHFGDKQGLYRAVAERFAGQLRERIRGVLEQDTPSRDLLAAAVDAYLAFLEEETNLYRFLVQRILAESPDMTTALMDFRGQVAADLTRILRDRLKPLGADTGGAEPWAHALVGMAAGAGEWWIDAAPGMSRHHLVDYLVTLLWDGFGGIEAKARR